MTTATTSWFAGSVKPARPGWYEVRESPKLHYNSRGHLTGNPFRYWNGMHWLTAAPNLSWSFISIFGSNPNHQWRGLADPHGTRRQGIGRIVDELATTHPKKSLQQLEDVAKLIWHEKNPTADPQLKRWHIPL